MSNVAEGGWPAQTSSQVYSPQTNNYAVYQTTNGMPSPIPAVDTTNGYMNGYPNPMSAGSTYTDMSNSSPPNYAQNGSPASYHQGDYPPTSYLPPPDNVQTQPATTNGGFIQPMPHLPDLGGDPLLLNDVLNDGANLTCLSAGLSGVSLEDEGQNLHQDVWMDPQAHQFAANQMYMQQQSQLVTNGYGESGSSNGGSMNNGGLSDNRLNSEYPVMVSHGVSEDVSHTIKILEEPMEFGYRFRYEVEGKAHGGLQGRSSKNTGAKKGPKVYPEIQICNVPDDVDVVTLEARLVAATEDYYPHPNKCSGKNCNPRGVFRLEIRRQEYPEFRYSLQNLTILQIKKQDQKQSLLDQLKDIDDIEKMMSGKGQTPEQLLKKAEELSKHKHNGVVRIRFQASFLDKAENKWKVAWAHSQPVHDQKQSNAAELRICRVSMVSSTVRGGHEVFLLCEKVSKDDIKVKFRDSQGKETDAPFQGGDVHYQYAIVFRVPPYKDLRIKEAVIVDMILFRPSTGTYSKAIPFTYYPIETENSDVLSRKRKRTDPPSNHGYGPMGGGGGGPSQYGHPFGGSPGSDNGGGGFGFPLSQGYIDPTYGYNRRVTRTAPDMDVKATSSTSTKEAEEPMDLSKTSTNPGVPLTIEDVEGDSSASRQMKADPASSVKQEPESPKSDKKSEDKPASPADKATPKSEVIESGVSLGGGDVDDLEIDGVCVETPQALVPIIQSEMKKPLVDYRQKPVPALRNMEKMDGQIEKLQKELETLKVQVADERHQNQVLNRRLYSLDQDITDTLMNYADTGNSDFFLSKFIDNLAYVDGDGNNVVHAAILNNQLPTLRQLLHICSSTKFTRPIFQRNNMNKTPLMVATYEQRAQMVEMLLSTWSNPLEMDKTGNNCFHVAAVGGDVNTLTILCKWLASPERKGMERRALDKTNVDGFTPLHIAVQGGHFECIKALVAAGADTNKGDGTSGRTPLHHAVLNRASSPHTLLMITELIGLGNADINEQAMDGNTALHFAVDKKDVETVKALVKYGADPDIENYQSNERDGDEDMIGNNAYDLCAEDDDLLNVLLAAVSQRTKVVVNHHPMTELRADVRMSLARELDHGDWKWLANKLGHGRLISTLETRPSPTKDLLAYLDSERSMDIRSLIETLESMGRQDCAKLVRGITLHRPQETSHRETDCSENPHNLRSMIQNQQKSSTRSVADSGYVGSVKFSTG